MVKRRRTIQAKTRANLQQEIESRCPFCGNDDVGHFQVHHIDENPENNRFENLLMLCPICHSKITKGEISHPDILGVKTTLLKYRKLSKKLEAKNGINIQGNISKAVIGNNNTVTINQKTSKRRTYPSGSIGSDNHKSNYVSYLITRYHEFKEWEVGKENMRYAAFPSHLKKKYRIGKQRTIYNVPIEKFDELVIYIQGKIKNTALAKINTAKGKDRHFISFGEYLE